MTKKARRTRAGAAGGRTPAHELAAPKRNPLHVAQERATAGYQDDAALDRRERHSDDVRHAAERIRRLAGFAIADLAWIRDHAGELAHRAECDAQAGFTAGGAAEVRGDNRNDDGSKSGPVPSLRLDDSPTWAADTFLGALRGARSRAQEAKASARRLTSMDADAARKLAETRRQTLAPGECENCGATIYPPEADEADEAKRRERMHDDDELCFPCRMYAAKTGQPRPIPPAADEAIG